MNYHALKGKPVLITGGSGFIGCNLVKKLVEVGAEVHIAGGNGSRGGRRNLEDVGFDIREGINYFKVDLRSESDSRRVIKDMHTVYHLAANIGGISYILENGIDVWKNNTLMDANVFQAVLNHSGVENFIYTSTACVYPLKTRKTGTAQGSAAWQESDAWTGETHSVYGGSKLVAEKALRMHVQNKNVKTAITRFHNVYGPRSVMQGSGAQVIQALIAKALNNPGQDLEIWGSGNQGRDFIHVSDVVDWLANVFYTKDGELPQEPIQRGSGVNTTIKAVAQAILDTLNSDAKIVHKAVDDEGEEGRISDNSKFKEYYPNFGEPLSIQAGIKDYIEWAIDREAWWKYGMPTVSPIFGPTVSNMRSTVASQVKPFGVQDRTTAKTITGKKLGTYLIEAGLLTTAQLENALKEQKKTPLRLGEVLAKLGWINQQTIEFIMEKVVLSDKALSVN